jgi:phosphoserine phosphatase
MPLNVAIPMPTARIAFFDFDGTITEGDSLLEFIRHVRGPIRYWIGFALCSPWIMAWKAGLLSNQQAKERVLRYFFGGMATAEFDALCRDFASMRLPQLIRPKALNEIDLLRERGFAVVIVSASPQDWIIHWTQPLGLALIASRLATSPSPVTAPSIITAPSITTVPSMATASAAPPPVTVLTGRIDGKNCHGEEKVSRIRAEYELDRYEAIYAYGDSEADRPMLALGTQVFYRPFR